MAKLILLNSTIILGSPKAVQAGSVLDTTTSASDITALQAAGGILMPQANPIIGAQALIAQSARLNKGRNEQELNALMLAAVAGTYESLQKDMATQAGALAELAIFSLAGAGSIVGVYFLSGTTTAYTAGNKQVYSYNIYDATGTLVGALASGTNGDGVAAQQMTKWSRFSFGAITNGLFQDGYTVTVSTALTGTAAIPTGQWVLATKPTY